MMLRSERFALVVALASIACIQFMVFAQATLPDSVASTHQLQTAFWMHIQKTSSWLGNFLLLWGCSLVRGLSASSKQHMLYAHLARNLSRLQCEIPFYTGDFGFGYHVPLNVNLNRTAITLYRNPYDRVISSFMFGKGVHQIMFPLGFPDRAKRKFALREAIRKSEFPILSYVQLPGISSCQAKMTLGRECGETAEVTYIDVLEAKRRIRYDLAFVGLTEESEASARLFLAMYPIPSGVTKMSVESRKNEEQSLLDAVNQAPRTNRDHTVQANEDHKKVLQQHNWSDTADVAVYREAVDVFYEGCRRYNIDTKFSKSILLTKL